jgi:hypothetical protein
MPASPKNIDTERQDEITENLLKDFGILVEAKQKATTYNSASGIFRAERVSLGTTELYEQIASSTQRQYLYKTVIIADSTIPNHFIDDCTLRETAYFVQTLCDLTDVYIWNGHDAILLDPDDVKKGEFSRLSQIIQPITPQELKKFRAKHNLQLNNSILLDHRNFQMMSHLLYIGQQFGEEGAHLSDVLYVGRKHIESREIGPRFTRLEFLNTMEADVRKKFAASLDSQAQPLHLLIDLDTPLEQPLYSVPPEFNRIIVYFQEIPKNKLEDFVQFVSLIPKPKLVGLVQLHDSHKCSFISDKAIAQIATQSPYLEYLSLGFCYENIEESLAALDIQNHLALRLFSLVEVRADGTENNHRSNAQLHNNLLEKLPNNLISLTLPYWVFGFESAQDHIGSRLNRLQTLVVEPYRINEYGGYTDELGEYTARLWPSPLSFSLVSESGNPVQKIIMKQTTGFLSKVMRQWFAFEVPLKQPEFRPLAPQIQQVCRIRYHETLGDLPAYSYSLYRCGDQAEAPEGLFESYWIDIEITKSWEKAWKNLSEAFQKTEQEKIRDSVSIRLKYIKKTENLWYLKKILSLFTQYFTEVDNLTLIRDTTDHSGVEVPLASSPLANLISDLNIARWSLMQFNWGTPTTRTSTTFTKEVNEDNDFYQKVANPTYHYRNLFTCLNNKNPSETPNYYIINTQNTQPDYLEIHTKCQDSMEALGVDNRQIPASEGDLFLAKYDYTTTNHKAKWIFIALPVPGPNTELLEFYCNTPYQPTLYFCQNSRQYFVWVYSEKAKTDIQFAYVLLSRPSQYLFSDTKTHSLAESDFELRFMRVLRFEKNAHTNSIEVTTDSMRQFIDTYQHLGLSLEQVLDIIVRYFRNFKDETLEVSAETDNIDMALFTQRRGVCRHRAKLSFKICKALLAQLGEPVSSQYAFTLVINDLHAFLIQTKKILKNTSSPEQKTPQTPLLSISDSQNVWEDPFQESTPWELDPLQANNSMDMDLGFGSFFTDESIPQPQPEQPETQVTILCLGGGEGGQVIELTQENSLPTEPDSTASSKPMPYQQDIQNIQNVQGVFKSNPSQDQDIHKLDNPFLKPYKHKVFLTKESFCLWLGQYQQPRPLLLVIDDWETWSKTKRVIRHSMQDKGRLFASISNFDDISLTKLPDMSTMPLQTFADITSTQRPLSTLGKMLKDPSANNPVLWVDIRDYSPALINPLFDHRRLLKGLQVPEHVTRIAVIDKAQFQEMGDDFISRFGKVVYTKLDFTQEEQTQHSNNMDIDLKQAEFYFDDPQQSFGEFAGKFEFYGEEIHYIRGWLEFCLKEGIEHITLSNCPVGMMSFDTLLRDLEEGVLPTPFAEYPVHFNITYNDEKRQGNYNRLQLALGNPQKIDFVLHANSFPTFVGTPTALDSQGRFITQKPYLVCSEQDTLDLLVLGKLSDEQWLRLDTYSNKFEKSLCLYFTSAEDIPSFLQVDIQEFSKEVPALAELCPANINWASYPENASPQDFADHVAGIYIDYFDPLDSLIGKIQKANTPSGFTFQESILVQRLRQGEEFYLFGSPNPEVLSFFTSLLCSTPHILVNGQIIPIEQRIKLRFTHQPEFALFDGESTTDKDEVMQETISSTPACMPEQLSASITQHPIIHLRHIRDVDGVALLMPTIQAMKYPLYREHREITTWLEQGGLFVINCLSEAPKDMLMLVRKFYYQQANIIFWDRRFYKTSPDKHRMLIVDYNDSNLLEQELEGITSQYLDSDTLIQDPENPVNAYYQKSNLSFYTKQLSAFMPIEQSLEMADLLENPQVLYKDKAKRKAFWDDCYRVLEAMMTTSPMKASFMDRLTPSQIPMALLLVLHLQMKETLTVEPGNSRLARGLILEGPPGIGKTRVIFELLHALGYEDKLALGNRVQSEKPGYVSAPTDDILICRQAIALAKQHGYILILDEINTLSYEENYRDCKTVMNQVRDFLSNTQTHSGILIASQNPSENFTGRNALNFLPYCFKAILPSASKQDYMHLAKALPRFSEKLAKQMKTASKLLSIPKHSSQFFPPNVRNYLAYIENHNPAKRKDRETEQDEKPGSKKPRL